MPEQTFIYPLRVYTEDTDCTGIVYHANYLKFFERARSEWAEQIGFGKSWQEKEQVIFVLRFARLDFLKPATLHQQVEVVTRISQIRQSSFIYDQYLRLSARPATILCKAEIKVACVGRDMRPCGLPQSLLEMIMEK